MLMAAAAAPATGSSTNARPNPQHGKGSPPCFLSDISGWRDGALYPLARGCRAPRRIKPELEPPAGRRRRVLFSERTAETPCHAADSVGHWHRGTLQVQSSGGVSLDLQPIFRLLRKVFRAIHLRNSSSISIPAPEAISSNHSLPGTGAVSSSQFPTAV